MAIDMGVFGRHLCYIAKGYLVGRVVQSARDG
jgi:hypothetical protein